MKSTKPVIGITMCYDRNALIHQDVDYDYIRRDYGEEVRRAGGQPIFLDNNIDPAVAVELCDGIIISGGQDIAPFFYGEAKVGTDIIEPAERTAWERHLIDICDRQGVRILGVCYGAQLLNVHYGGSLYQDITSDVKGALQHHLSSGLAMHSVTFDDDFLGFQASETVAVASRHHQAVRRIAPGFEVIARAEDGIIEAIAGQGHYGIQWHAESDGTASAIYHAFVTLCSKKRRPLHPYMSARARWPI